MNRGVQVLRGEIRERGDQVKLAKRLQRDEGELSRVLRGLSPSLSFRQRAYAELGIEMHWWEEPEGPASASDEDEPTAPELPALLEQRRSSRPPAPLADAADIDDETTRRDHVPPQPVRVSEREPVDTQPETVGLEELPPIPKRLTALDVRIDTPSPERE